MEEHESRVRHYRALVAALALLSLTGLAACTGSPATLALQPDFQVRTPSGTASVSIRDPWPGMTDSEFTRLVETGMARAGSGMVISGPVDAPFPERRIVWHVSRGSGRGVSILAVNIFDGSVPVSYEQDVVANDAPAAAIEAMIGSLTTRLVVAYQRREVNAPIRATASQS